MMDDRQLKHVLIVDDEPNVALMLADSLEKLGEDYVIETAHSGGEAQNKIQQTQYALVITDYKMPGMSGLDLAQAVRDFSPDTQIMMMTAYGTDELRDLVEQMNIDGYLDKPFTVTKIRDMVERIVGDSTTARPILIMEDNDDLRHVFSRVLRRSGYKVYAAATMQEARDLLVQIDFGAFLCDIHMGDERGTDLVREQGDALKERGTQVIVVTGESRYRPFAEELGVEFYLEKPVALGPLVTLVDRLTAQG